jgi:hypothetical protein
MPASKAWSIFGIAAISHLLHWGSNDQHTHDDGQGLLADDHLNIELEDRWLDVDQASPHHTRPRAPASETDRPQYTKPLLLRLLGSFRHEQTFIVVVCAMVTSVLLWALLATTAKSAQPLARGLLLCGSQRYSVENVSVKQKDDSCPILTLLANLL